jgi:hypothetical protein
LKLHSRKKLENMTEYKNPKIFADLLLFFKKCYSVHQGLPKLFRIAISEKLLNEITECMKLVALANFKKGDKLEILSGAQDLKELRGRIEVIKAYLLVAWEMKHYSHAFFAEVNERIEEISKQAASWEKWMQMQK